MFPTSFLPLVRMLGRAPALLTWGRALLALLAVSFSTGGWAAERAVYCDSAAAGPGDGTLGNPYRSLAQIPWTTIGGWASAGDSVNIALKRGSLFRETFTITTSGAPGRPIIISDYGEGLPPRIYGDKAYVGWATSNAGANLFEVADPNITSAVWTNDVPLFKGTNASVLRPGEWISSGGFLRFRCDLGNPDALGLEVRGAIRPYGIIINASNLTFKNLVAGYTRNQAVRILGGEGITFESCTLVASPESAWVANTSALFLTCRFINGQVTIDNPAANARLLYCLLQHDPEYGHIRNLNVLNAAAVAVLNSAFVGGCRNQVFNSAAGNLGFTNCIFTAHGSDLDSYGDPTIQSSVGVCVIDHCSVLPSGRNTDFLKGVTLGRSNLYLGPKFRNYARDGIIMPQIDDYENLNTWDLVCQKADIFGFKATFAISQTHVLALDNPAKARIHALIAEGHGIAAHTRSHAELGVPLAFTLRYLGSGNSCSLNVSGGRLTTTIENDTNGDAVDLDLSIFAKDAVGPSDALIRYLDAHPQYECHSGRYPNQNFGQRVPLEFLFPVQIADIKAAAGSVFYETNSWYRYEIIGSKTDLETAFPEAGNLLGFVYPSSGYLANDGLKAIGFPMQFGAGFRYGRTVNRVKNWVRTRMNMFDASVGKSLVLPICLLKFEGDCNDILNSRHFTGSNVTFVASQDTTGPKAVSFNGTSSMISRTNDPAWDYSWRDWMVRVKIRPQSLSREQTLWYHGANSDNHLRLFLTGDGRLAFEVLEQGVVRLALMTQPGLLSTTQTKSVAMQQAHDRWQLWIGNEMVAATTNLFTIQPQEGPLILGCAPGTTPGEIAQPYGGLMDDVTWVILGYAQSASIAETVAFSGGALAIYGHNETFIPSELWRLGFQAWKESGVNVCVTNVQGAISRLLETGTMDPTDAYLYTGWHGTNDFRLQPSSPCIDAAEPSALLSYPDIHDLAGNRITDHQGNLLVPGLDVGPYESAFDPEMRPLLSISTLPEGLVRIRLPAVTTTPGVLEATEDLETWVPIETNSTPVNGFYEFHEPSGPHANSYLRARLLP
jgi:hypothetical protein